ncbi:MAG TPA: hypothetical protein VK338_06040 [Candidatus Nitrosocosmicus sp.]|nr:hypothetical protein [Candidatus Nitrosocosmicus sp.]
MSEIPLLFSENTLKIPIVQLDIDIPMDREKPGEECGIFGVYYLENDSDIPIVNTLMLGLHENQHRGEESAGFAVGNGETISKVYKKMGRVSHLAKSYERTQPHTKEHFIGNSGAAHTRYSTTGGSNLKNAAPFRCEIPGFGPVVVAHNGNIPQAAEIRSRLEELGHRFVSTTDSEIIGPLIKYAKGKTFDEKVQNALRSLGPDAAFSMILSTPNALYAASDSMGNRPLSYANFDHNGRRGYAISSETPAFDTLDMNYISDVKPGELIKFNKNGIRKFKFTEPNPARCGIEITYIMRPSSRVEGVQVADLRRTLGEELAIWYPPPEDVDLITYIPASAEHAAEGYQEMYRNLRLRSSMSKNRYGTLSGAMRGFMQPEMDMREFIAQKNYHMYDIIGGKNIVIVDDSIIRGVTTRAVMNKLREYGPKSIHLRIVFPEVADGCPFGTDIGFDEWLLARELESIDAMADHLGVDSLGFLTPEQYQHGVDKAMGKHYNLCLGCAKGQEYPVPITRIEKTVFEACEPVGIN